MSKFSQTIFSQAGRAKSVVSALNRNILIVNVISLALVAIVSVVYIGSINHSVTKGYKIRALETQIHDLTLANEQLDIVSHQATSLDHISRSVKMLGMVKSGQPLYLLATEPSYAMAR